MGWGWLRPLREGDPGDCGHGIFMECYCILVGFQIFLPLKYTEALRALNKPVFLSAPLSLIKPERNVLDPQLLGIEENQSYIYSWNIIVCESVF